METNIDKILINRLLSIIDRYNTDNVFKEIILFTEIQNDTIVIYSLITKGERDIGTRFYSGSECTHICKEYWHNGNVIFADMINIADENF